jgi:hypothetical protein
MSGRLEKSVGKRLRVVAQKLRHCAGKPLVLPLMTAAIAIGCSVAELERQVKAGRLQVGWSGGHQVVSVSEVDRFRRERVFPRR